MEQIFFIGLGHMGNPMASRLLQHGYPLTVYDINPASMQLLTDQGARAVKTLHEGVQEADIILTMLQTGQQVTETCKAIFAKPGTLYIDASSIDIAVTRELHKATMSAGIHMLDAPVSGGVAAASAGTLTFMVGGEEETFIKAKPILERMGKKLVHVGAGGLGQVAKICNNLILGISMIAVSEGFSLAEKLGLDAKKFFEVASNASSQCWSMTKYCPVPGVIENVPSNRDYQPGFMAKMMLKDLLLGMKAAEIAHTSLPLGSLATELYTTFVNQGNGDIDFSAIIKMIGKI